MWFSLQPCDLDYGTQTRHHFENTVVLDASPQAVFALLVDPAPWKDWFPDMVGGRWTCEPPHAVGSTREMHMRFMRVHERFTAYEPGVRWAFYLDRATVPMASRFMEDYQLTDLGDGRTQLTWLVHFQPPWYLRPGLPLVRPIFRRMFRKAAVALQDYVRRELTA